MLQICFTSTLWRACLQFLLEPLKTIPNRVCMCQGILRMSMSVTSPPDPMLTSTRVHSLEQNYLVLSAAVCFIFCFFFFIFFADKRFAEFITSWISDIGRRKNRYCSSFFFQSTGKSFESDWPPRRWLHI